MNSACFSGGEGRANARVSLPTFPAADSRSSTVICTNFTSLSTWLRFAPVVAGAVLLSGASCSCYLVGFGRQKIGVLLAKRCFLSSEAAGGVGGVSL